MPTATRVSGRTHDAQAIGVVGAGGSQSRSRGENRYYAQRQSGSVGL